jgi:hypothetical protein
VISFYANFTRTISDIIRAMVEYLPKDILLYLCNFMDVHTYHRFALCSKEVFRKTQTHISRQFRGNGCFNRRLRQYLQRKYFCARCELWMSDITINHKRRCDNRIATSYKFEMASYHCCYGGYNDHTLVLGTESRTESRTDLLIGDK